MEYFAKDKLLSNLLKDECDTPFCDVLWCMLLFNEIFKSGNWGVTLTGVKIVVGG